MNRTSKMRSGCSRRELLWASALGTAALLGAALPGRPLAADLVEMRIAAVVADTSSVYVGTDLMKQELEGAYPDRFELTVHKGTLGKGERQLYEALQLGTLDGVLATTGPLSAFVPEADLFNLPFLFKSPEHAFRVVDGEVGEWFNEKMLEKGFRVLGWWTIGTRNTSNSVRAIEKPSDYEGLKIRTMESPPFIALYKALGATPVPMSINEVYTALQQGTIDGIDGSLPAQLEFKHIEVLDYAAVTDHVVLLFPFTVSEAWWQSLPEDLRGAIAAAEKSARVEQRAADQAYSEKIEAEWKAQGKTVTHPEIGPFQEIAKQIYPQFYDQVGGKEIFDKIEAIGEGL
ncbi:MAG: TRAP transporter substrate-binding protein [Tistlia sp.]|uniref:TRAP transporter substrate-binding protein n=1 Tax=Tistlia sp. TaxID=3057121 RepID=UPI0034A2BFD3